MEIKQAIFPKDNENVLKIFREYIKSASVSLDFQNNEIEFENLSKKYSEKDSKIFLVWHNNQVIGCASFRYVTSIVCEMKRVYLRKEARGKGIGRRLVETIILNAKESGYKRICLDVLPEFTTATKIYELIGFKPTKPITNNPIPGTKFLGLEI